MSEPMLVEPSGSTNVNVSDDAAASMKKDKVALATKPAAKKKKKKAEKTDGGDAQKAQKSPKSQTAKSQKAQNIKKDDSKEKGHQPKPVIRPVSADGKSTDEVKSKFRKKLSLKVKRGFARIMGSKFIAYAQRPAVLFCRRPRGSTSTIDGLYFVCPSVSLSSPIQM